MTVLHPASDNSVTPFVRSLLPAVQRGDAAAVRMSISPRVRFEVFIDRHIETYHGLTTLPVARKALEIKKIETGLVEDWNNRNPSLAVAVGDHIIQVNEIVGDAKAISAELGHYKELTLV